MADRPAVTEARGGDGGVCESEKSEKKIARDTVVVWLPLVPVTVKSTGDAGPGLETFDERPLTVSSLVWPAVIEVGLKLHVAPLLHERLMVPRNELGAEAPIVNVVELVPMRSRVDRALVESEKTALPVPLRGTA